MLRQSDEEILEINSQIANEVQAGVIADPLESEDDEHDIEADIMNKGENE